MKQIKSVYALVDPRDSQVFYIGKTVHSPSSRAKSHMTDGKNSDKVAWIADLIQHGLTPSVEILESGTYTDDELNELEIAWIAEAREEGWPIVNIQIGGRNGRIINDCVRKNLSRAAKLAYANDPSIVERVKAKRLASGGYALDQVTKNKISNSLSRYWADPENTEAILAALDKRAPHLTEEHKSKISKALTGHVKTQETRDKLSKANTGKKASDTTRAKLSSAQRKRFENMTLEERRELSRKATIALTGREVSQETRAKISAAHKGKPSPHRGKQLSETTKNKMKEAHLRRWARIREEGRYEEVCSNIADGTKKAMERPEIRAKVRNNKPKEQES